MIKFRYILIAVLINLCTVPAIAKVVLPKIISDGMVIQREHPAKIWGKADADEKISISFKKKQFTTYADADGNWMIVLPSMKAGGPYDMYINDIHLSNILIGDVWLCSGQSNMELMVYRVNDMFGKETATYENPMIHYVKTPLGNELSGPRNDFPSITWQPLTKQSAPSFSALAYFYAKKMYENTHIPIGIINSSWGGSAIEAWISEEGLSNFPKALNERDIYNSDEYRTINGEIGNMTYSRWAASLYKSDEGIHSNTPWYSNSIDDSKWNPINIFSTTWATKNGYPVNGAHWFRQHINLTEEQASQDAILRVGTIVDADSVYVNGILVGTTAYQYPPRIYRVPNGILKTGDNQITIRLISYSGMPRFVTDKPYCIICGNDTLRLPKEWKYKIGSEMPQRTDPISFQNIPTGMYNSMIAPLRNLSFKGAIWYQGETNTGRPNEYEQFLTAMINDWREKLNDRNLPFVIVQLPNFMQTHNIPTESNWATLREAQRQAALKIAGTDLAVAIDLGEWNDIHPQNKKELARRISLLTMKRLYGQKNIVAEGPVCTSMTVTNSKAILSFKESTDDFSTDGSLEGFSIAGDDGIFHWAHAEITKDNKIMVWNDQVKNPVRVRYAWDDNPKANLKNKSGLPASPFQVSSTLQYQREM